MRRTLILLVPWLGRAAVLEVGARVLTASPASPRPMGTLRMAVPDSARVWRYRARHTEVHRTPEFEVTVRSNRLGLRDGAPQVNADIRILVIGDSFVFGWGVEEPDRFTELLEDSLRSAYPELAVQVLNAGHWTYSFDQQLLTARELVPRFRPQLVLQGVYGPHVATIGSHAWSHDPDGYIRSIRFRGLTERVHVAADGALRRSHPLIDSPPLGSRVIAKAAQYYLRWRQARSQAAALVSLLDAADDSWSGAWARTDTALDQTARVLADEGVDHLVFEVPQDLQASRAEWPEWTTREAADRTIEPELPTRRFEAALDGSGAGWVSLLDAFRERYRRSLLRERPALDRGRSSTGRGGPRSARPVATGRHHGLALRVSEVERAVSPGLRRHSTAAVVDVPFRGSRYDYAGGRLLRRAPAALIASPGAVAVGKGSPRAEAPSRDARRRAGARALEAGPRVSIGYGGSTRTRHSGRPEDRR